MSKWEIVNLFDICSPKQWKTVATKNLLKEGYPVYGANGIIGYYNQYTHKDPTLLITCRGATCGELNITQEYSYVNGNAMALDNLSKNCFLNYLYYYLKKRGFKDVISGSAQPQITQEGLKNVYVPLPPLEIQKQIAEKLDKIQEIINKRKEQIVKMDEFLKSVFLDMFGDPIKNSKKFQMLTLDECGVLERGKSKHRPRNAPELLGGPYPLIQTGDISNCKIYLKNYTQTYSELGLKQSKMWKAGTLVITIAANIAQTAILMFDACFPDSIVGFIPNNKVNSLYIKFWLMNLQPIIESQAPQSAQKNINLKILKELEIPLPPIELQNKFASIVEKVEEEKEKLEKSLEEMEILFKAEMQRSFQ